MAETCKCNSTLAAPEPYPSGLIPRMKVRQSGIKTQWGDGKETFQWEVRCPFVKCRYTEYYLFWDNAVHVAHNHMTDHGKAAEWPH